MLNRLFRDSNSAKLSHELFGKGLYVPHQKPQLSEMAQGTVWTVGNYTTFSRALEDLGVALGMKGFFSTQDMLVTYQTFGTVTGINTLIGIAKIFHGFAAKRSAEALGDKKGTLMGRVSIGAGAALTGGGASFAAFRGLAIYGAVKELGTASLVGRLTAGFAQIGMIFFTLFFTLLAVATGMKLHESSKLRAKLQGAGDIQAQKALLEKKFQAEPGRVMEKLIAQTGSKEGARQVLQQEAIETGKTRLKELAKELGLSQISEEKCEEIVRETVRSQTGFFQSMDDKLSELGLGIETDKTQKRKEEKMARVLTEKGIAAVRELSSSKASETLMKEIEASNKGRIKEYAAVIAVLLVGMIALSSAIVLTGGVGAIVVAVMMIGFAITMAMLDGYYLYQSYKEELPAKHDRKLLALSSLLALASLVSMLALGFTGVISFGIVPILITAVLAAMWLSQNGVTLYVMDRNEKRAEIKTPTFETLLKALDQDLSAKAEAMLKNLTEEQRDLLSAEMKRHAGNMRDALSSVIEKADQARERHSRALREEIAKVAIS